MARIYNVDIVLHYIHRIHDALARYHAVLGGDDHLPIRIDWERRRPATADVTRRLAAIAASGDPG